MSSSNGETEMVSNLSTGERLNLETAHIAWTELQRFFAQGLMVIVDESLDLIEVAALFVDDNSHEIQTLTTAKKVRVAETVDAKKWNEANTEFWAVVTVPWVLVQEIKPG